MFTRFSVSAIVILAALVWGATLWLLNVEIGWEYIKPFSVTVATVTVILTAYDRFLWRIASIRWFHTMPNISGNWDVELRSTYIDPNTKERSPLIRGNAVVKQTFSTLSIRITTASMKSYLIAERLIRHGDGASEIIGVYQSDPDIQLRGTQSEIHYGAFRYIIVGNPPTEMTGHYWTDRNTRGSIRLTPKNK